MGRESEKSFSRSFLFYKCILQWHLQRKWTFSHGYSQLVDKWILRIRNSETMEKMTGVLSRYTQKSVNNCE